MTTGATLANRLLGPGILRLLRTQVSGLGNVPRHGGVLFAANHRSFLDHILLAAASPRPLLFLGKTELSTGIAGRANIALGMIPVERGSGDLGALDQIVDLLRAGRAVALFPEGTRSPSGELFRFRSGLARLAAGGAAPVVPVGLLGTAEVWPRGEKPKLRRPTRGTLAVRFGPVVPAPGTDARSRRAFTETVQASVARLCDQSLADRFAAI